MVSYNDPKLEPAKKTANDNLDKVGAEFKKFRYATADPSVATVSASGVIKGVKAGKTTIYVYARNGHTKSIKVTVRK
ncbi:MAG: Ig-like domain-containing protein [Lachnospiraceae bacterium]|nr:Ig-like domain-containing protein [Lachnospiraceae bacterium]